MRARSRPSGSPRTARSARSTRWAPGAASARRTSSRAGAQSQRGERSAGRVDSPVDGAPAPSLDEGLVVLVAGGVPARDQKGEQSRAARPEVNGERPPPQETKQGVLA